MRLYLRDQAARWAERLAMLIDTIVARIGRDGAVPMPGYTHLQPAMPSSVGLWLQAAAEALLEQMHAIADLARRLDSCPLGTGAGFGCGLPLDRLYTAELLGSPASSAARSMSRTAAAGWSCTRRASRSTSPRRSRSPPGT
jgi:argininosuccinate lyase